MKIVELSGRPCAKGWVDEDGNGDSITVHYRRTALRLSEDDARKLANNILAAIERNHAFRERHGIKLVAS